ncbi:hypothetical protein [Dehalogenimonas alkenigignens]|uniref:hypothetical protein n=1 Tax=Dehalogenimonas alkenigignens TaxID=1217799 RepID=UPI000D579B06|nr:hypothetical protein [Dehalogenimonas alkenigignens]PVV83990.1 hypothetical protein DD509_04780 [Dehalogenimonas alkenigignens]
MRVIRFVTAVAIFGLAYISSPSSTCYANSPPPPRIVIVVSGAPDDLELHIGEAEASRHDRLNEAYFTVYPFGQTAGLVLTVETGGSILDLPLGKVSLTYNNVFVLDLDAGTISAGEPSSRFLWLPVTIFLTILLEGLIFYAFKYRSRKSWIIFLVINLVTQIGLYYWLGQSTNFADGYVILSLIVGEIGVFIAEAILCIALLREHGRLRAASYAVTANAFSLAAGAWLLLSLPTGF